MYWQELWHAIRMEGHFWWCFCFLLLAWGGLVRFCASALPHFRARAVIVCFCAFAFPLLGVLPVFASRFILVLLLLLLSASLLLSPRIDSLRAKMPSAKAS